ncbi:MAG: hypothetical protein QOJ09_1939 [Actinomycetota bacterium]|nr:hypothetical protein [Actinomycetota bacterium]
MVLPVEVRDARVAAATFLVAASAAQRLVAPTGLTVRRLPGGRAVCSLAFIDYRDNDLGQYHEVAVALLVRPHDGSKGVGAYIHQLPVDGAFTCAAGRTIWGFPKFIAEAPITERAGGREVVLSEGGRHALTLSVRRRPLPMPGREATANAYSFLDGVLRCTPWTVRPTGVRGGPGGASLVLGNHAMADELRSLGLPKRAVFSSTIERMGASFGPAEEVSPVRS